jgi:RHS repeat-associated protein
VLCGGDTCYPREGAASQAIGQQFTGMMHDFGTGMDYFYARYYSGAQGRFTSSDIPFIDQYPGNPQSWNLYGYVRNNPLVYVDLNGRQCFGQLPNGEPCPTDPGGVSRDEWCLRFDCNPQPGSGKKEREPHNPPPQLPPDILKLGIRAAGETFGECMERNASAYSVAGILDLITDGMISADSRVNS